MVKNSRLMGQEELVLQTSPEEIGKAALAMILACFGKTVTMEELGGPIHNAAELVSAAQEQGLAARGLRMTVEEVEKAPLPLIAHWRFRAFVVVTKVKGNRVWISSPEEGFLTLSRKEFQQGFTGVALCFALPGEGTPESSGGDSDGEKDKKPSAVQKPARKKAEKEEGGLKGMLPPAAWALLGVIQLFIAAGYGLLAILCRRLAMGLSAPQQVHGVGLCLFIAGLLLALGGAEIFQTWLVHRGQEKKRREFRQLLHNGVEGSVRHDFGIVYFMDVVQCLARLCKMHAAGDSTEIQTAGRCQLPVAEDRGKRNVWHSLVDIFGVKDGDCIVAKSGYSAALKLNVGLITLITSTVS